MLVFCLREKNSCELNCNHRWMSAGAMPVGGLAELKLRNQENSRTQGAEAETVDEQKPAETEVEHKPGEMTHVSSFLVRCRKRSQSDHHCRTIVGDDRLIILAMRLCLVLVLSRPFCRTRDFWTVHYGLRM